MVANPRILKKKKKPKPKPKPKPKSNILKSETNGQCNQTLIDVERKKERNLT